MLRYIATSVAFFLSLFFLTAQNLVPNYSFEEFEDCPTGLKQLDNALHWQKANAGTPELFHYCGFSINVSPFDGEGMAGLILHTDYSNTGVEYIQVKLMDSLKRNQNYCFSYYIRLAEESPIAINKIGAYFSKDRLYSPNWKKFKKFPQMVYEEVVENKTEWLKIKGTFEAKGGEEYLTMGCFFEKHFLKEKLLSNNLKDWMSYYYIDKVELYETEGTCGMVKREEEPIVKQDVKWGHTVYFDKDSYSINDEEKLKLNQFLKQLPKPIFSPIKVEGHTDTDASLEYNLQLSRNRANMVEKIIVSSGLSNVYSSWAGEEKLLNKDRNRTEKALNRRVEIEILQE